MLDKIFRTDDAADGKTALDGIFNGSLRKLFEKLNNFISSIFETVHTQPSQRRRRSPYRDPLLRAPTLSPSLATTAVAAAHLTTALSAALSPPPPSEPPTPRLHPRPAPAPPPSNPAHLTPPR